MKDFQIGDRVRYIGENYAKGMTGVVVGFPNEISWDDGANGPAFPFKPNLELIKPEPAAPQYSKGDRVRYVNALGSNRRLDGVEGTVTDVHVPTGKPYVLWDNGYKATYGAPHSKSCVIPVPAEVAEKLTPRAELLREAERLITGERNATYGSPTQNFQDTAAIWTVQLGHKLKEGEVIDPGEVAALMIGLKLARIKASPKRDNWADIAGYSGCGFEADIETGKISD